MPRIRQISLYTHLLFFELSYCNQVIMLRSYIFKWFLSLPAGVFKKDNKI